MGTTAQPTTNDSRVAGEDEELNTELNTELNEELNKRAKDLPHTHTHTRRRREGHDQGGGEEKEEGLVARWRSSHLTLTSRTAR